MLITQEKNILILGKGFTQGLDNTTIYAEKRYSINFTKTNIWGSNSIIMDQIAIFLLMVLRFINLKQKILRL